MVIGANITEVKPAEQAEELTGASAEPMAPSPMTASPMAAEPVADHLPVAPESVVPSTANPMSETPRRVGNVALKTLTGIARSIIRVTRYGALAARQVWCAFEAVSPAVKRLTVTGLLTLLGVAGALTFHNAFGVICIVVIVPACAAVIGALGYRMYNSPATAAPAASDLQRSVEYVDKKLALALSSFGTDHHQQALIALFQAKTAVEITLGTEQDAATYADVSLRLDDYPSRARIRSGTGPTSALREENSLAAS